MNDANQPAAAAPPPTGAQRGRQDHLDALCLEVGREFRRLCPAGPGLDQALVLLGEAAAAGKAAVAEGEEGRAQPPAK